MTSPRFIRSLPAQVPWTASFRLWEYGAGLAPLAPRFFPSPNGAGGSTRDLTHEIGPCFCAARPGCPSPPT